MLDSCYAINDVLVHPRKNIFERNGEVIEVTPKSIQILHYLVSSQGRLVTYHQLSEEIWGGDVSDGALYQQMTQLRRALGDNPNQPSFIKTLPRQGYKFIAKKQDNINLERKIIPQPKLDKINSAALKKWAPIITAAVIVTAAILTSLFVTISHNNSSLSSQLTKLTTPTHQIVILKEDKAHRSIAASATDILLQFYLDGVKNQHVISVNNKISSDILTHTKNHINPKKLTIIKIQEGNKQLLVSINSDNQENNYYFRQISPTTDITTLNNWLQEKLKKNNITIQPAIDMKADFSAKAALKSAINDSSFIATSRLQVEAALDNASRALKLNPNNLLSYSLFFDRASDLLDLSGGFDLDQNLSIIKQQAKHALRLSPNYYKAHFALAEVYCNLQQNDLCFNHLNKAISENPFQSMTLSVLNWNLSQQGIKSKKLAYYNFILNPTYPSSKTFYRNRLLETGKISEAIRTMDNINYQYTNNPDDNNWNYISQSSQKILDLHNFSRHYRHSLTPNLVNNGAKLSRYIGYKFLDSNRPTMAMHWLNNGHDDVSEYLEVQIIGILADIWQNKTITQKWQQIRSLAEDRKKFQDPVDKFRIAYFDYMLNYLNSCADKLLQVHPQLGSENLAISRDNFRLSVYYAETLKRQGNFKKATSINKKLRFFLKTDDSFSLRRNDIGISDVEFYALNGDQNKAMERLKQAINQQGWLPNAYWLWLPLDKNPWLKSLYVREDFKQLHQLIEQKLDKLCFDKDCS